jgi:hypothetical protein
MLAPLGVTRQHKTEADDIGIDACVSRDGGPQDARIVIANYERLHLFNPSDFAGIILDESSILKSFSGQTTKRLIEAFARTPYRLACTATPAPNDHTELGTHAEFLGIMTRDQMLMRWFLHDSADTGTWRLKGHGVRPFWDWVASWARCVSKPSDLGFSDAGFDMPELNMHRHLVAADRTKGKGEEKDGQAMFELAQFYLELGGEEKIDDDKAWEWLNKSADTGNPNALATLGSVLFDGKDFGARKIEADPKAAVEKFTKLFNMKLGL